MVARTATAVVAIVITGALAWGLRPGSAVTAVTTGFVLRESWPDGTQKREAAMRGGVYDGDYRTWHPNGRPAEVRRYRDGRQEGLQQAWTADGVLYLNYEVRDGRRYGMVNARPCVTVGGDDSGLPYYDTADFTPRWTPGEHRVGRFTGVSQTGATVRSDSLSGRVHIASFIYTTCAAVCPLIVRQLGRVQSALADRPAVRLVSFTVTPETDTPGVLAAFGRTWGVDATRWWLVRTPTAALYPLARDGYFADDARVGRQGDAEAFLHTEKVMLVDGEGRLRGVYNGTVPREVDLLIADARRLVDASGSNGEPASR